MIYRIARVWVGKERFEFYIVEKYFYEHGYKPVYQGNEILLWETVELAAAYLCGLDYMKATKVHTALVTLVDDNDISI